MQELVHAIEYCVGKKDSPMHSHSDYQIIFVKTGNIELTVAGQKYTVGSNSLVFISNFELHNVKVLSADYERFYITISRKAISHLIKNSRLLSVFGNRPSGTGHVIKLTKSGELICILLEKILNEYSSNNAFSHEMIELALKELLITLYRLHPEAYPECNDNVLNSIWDIKQYIEKNCHKSITLNEIVEGYYLSSCYLSHKFKNVTGYSIMQYVKNCRLSLARELLCNSGLPVSEVAMEAGFSDINNFGRMFRREIGCTPSYYRKKHRCRFP